jgi:hypothetical protein
VVRSQQGFGGSNRRRPGQASPCEREPGPIPRDLSVEPGGERSLRQFAPVVMGPCFRRDDDRSSNNSLRLCHPLFLLVIARSDLSAVAKQAKAEATKQSILSFRGQDGLLRCARNDGGCYCVFATRGGVAVVTNCVASSMAWPNGVGSVMRNGTSTRVPAIGTKAISMFRAAARYLMIGRSGI